MPESVDARAPGVVPASIAAGIAFATTAAYVVVLIQEGPNGLSVLAFAIYFAGLGRVPSWVRPGEGPIGWCGSARRPAG